MIKSLYHLGCVMPCINLCLAPLRVLIPITISKMCFNGFVSATLDENANLLSVQIQLLSTHQQICFIWIWKCSTVSNTPTAIAQYNKQGDFSLTVLFGFLSLLVTEMLLGGKSQVQLRAICTPEENLWQVRKSTQSDHTTKSRTRNQLVVERNFFFFSATRWALRTEVRQYTTV